MTVKEISNLRQENKVNSVVASALCCKRQRTEDRGVQASESIPANHWFNIYHQVPRFRKSVFQLSSTRNGVIHLKRPLQYSELQTRKGTLPFTEWHKEEIGLPEDTPRSMLAQETAGNSDPRFLDSNHGSLVVSLSNGSLCVLNPDSTGNLTIVNWWHAHNYEPWSAAWNYWDTSIVYSGGDDLTMKGGMSDRILASPSLQISGIHWNVGLCFAINITVFEVAHSYDNNVCIFDTRKPLVPLVQGDVGGGMHDGFKVVKAHHGEDVTWEIVKRFDDHKLLAYGADWSFAPPGADGETLIASCSFYDQMLHLWSG
ncbi:hypothetical protein EV702DRAFT_1048974 [Suillus placidus]|uniref:Uncharacterized protein n=1 Tax=Suillus placidus TaxID=48579 RepID=A0A9P6ZMF7_9AGAM|nr:hypothetical protein EV702DRAFT_1048974 [Suillus placidus]